MASIDKIYVNKKQFIQLRDWYDLMKDTKLIDTKLIPFNQYDLTEIDWDNKTDTKPVWNLSEKADMWLLSNCPFDFVKKKIKSNYNLD